MPKFWTFKNVSPAGAEEEIELRIDGDIVDDESVWLYELFGSPATSPNVFKEELKQYTGKNITLWINSNGGSVFAAAGIYNALMEHKKAGAKITAKVEKAFSAATIPLMAADIRLITPGGGIFLHNPLTTAKGYAKDLIKAADMLGVIKETIINAYEIGTGRSRMKISKMMDEETLLDAREAIKEGFATGMLYADSAKSVEDVVAFNFLFSQMAVQNAAGDSIQKFFELAKSTSQPQAPGPQAAENKTSNQEGDDLMPPKTIEELRNAYPDLVKQVEDAAREEGRKQERTRIQNIEKISKNIAPDLVNKAKFEEPMDAEKLAFEALQKDNGLAQQHLENLQTETKNSGVNNVTGTPLQQKTEADKKEAENKAIDDIAAGANARRGK